MNFKAFVLLTVFWLKHWLLDHLRKDTRRSAGRSRRRRGGRRGREEIFVDASYRDGLAGIGIWVPRRRIALAIKVDAVSSMEAEILALLAGAMLAKRMKAKRPVIFSDCKSAVRTATRHLNITRMRGLRRKLSHLAELSTEHRAFRHVFDTMTSLRGTMQWQPREANREADLASNIGSRIGNMGIVLSGSKNRNHALNDVLSRALPGPDAEDLDGGIIRRRYRCGTRTVSLSSAQSATSRRFHRDARGLIARLSAEVA